ncbi:hypothetical protein [Corynebacterium sp. HMSC29G08]|uniref:hypothetical protein n=1 Tax=Corynebacterium sp. HMSC29G08 TaxID=1581069 RepID=UPI0008A23785|nr:hypothetical protein [Corynebacterium sp. HMSC29G08]OFT83668.1 hypothetical protein HMPREF3101_05345 [Corynebacterium sp. HMSC29G08]
MSSPFNPNQQPQFGGQPQFGPGPMQGPGPAQGPGQQFAGQPFPGQQLGQPAPKRRGPGWPTWSYLALTVVSLLSSFLPVAVVGFAWEGLGSAALTFNWWGSMSYEGTGLTSVGEEYFREGLGGPDAGMLIGTIAVILLYIGATVFGFFGRDKVAAIVAAVAGGAQLLTTISTAFQIDGMYGSLGAGWYLWLLCSLIAIGIAVWMLVKGTRPAPAPQSPFGQPQPMPQQGRGW